jgi:peptide/nickel transport system substrate-binding protein
VTVKTRRRSSLTFAALLALVIAAAPSLCGPAAAAPEGQVTFAVTVTLAPTWFDPAETPGVITPFLTLYALHDALVKPMPGNPWAPSLAESWTASTDGLTYEFVLRKGVRFHNGDPVTAEDVKFSLERYKGGGATNAEGAGRGGRDRRPSARAVPHEAAVARLHDVLRDAGDQRRLDRSEEVRRARR